MVIGPVQPYIYSSINHDKVSAQLKTELANGARHWLTNRERREIEVNNALTLLDVPRIHTRYCNMYCLKRVEREA